MREGRPRSISACVFSSAASLGQLLGRCGHRFCSRTAGSRQAARPQLHDFGGDGRKRDDLVGRAERDRLLRHAEYDAGLLVLRDGRRAGLLHLQQALGAVVAHPGHDDPERIGARVLGGGAEQHVDRRAVARDQRAVPDGDVIARAAALQEHVAIARRDERAAGDYRIAVLGLLDVDLAKPVEALGEGGGEMLGHVLDDRRCRDCRAAAPCSTSRSDSVPPVEAPMQTTCSVVRVSERSLRGGGMMTSAVSFFCVSRARTARRRSAARAAARTASRDANLRFGEELLGVDARLLNHLDRAGLQRVEQTRPIPLRAGSSTARRGSGAAP